MITIEEAKQLIHNNGVQVVDLRGAAEFNAGHISKAENIFVGTLPENLEKIKKDRKVIIHCQGGDRSSIAYSLLVKKGYTNLVNFSGGINEWVNAAEAVVS